MGGFHCDHLSHLLPPCWQVAKATDSTCAPLPVSAEACWFSLVSQQLFFFNVVCFVVLVVVFFLPQPTEGFGGAGRGGDFLSVKQVSSLWADIRSTELEIPEYGSKLVVFQLGVDPQYAFRNTLMVFSYFKEGLPLSKPVFLELSCFL